MFLHRLQGWTGLEDNTQTQGAIDSWVKTPLQCHYKCFMHLFCGDTSGAFSIRGNVELKKEFNTVLGMRFRAFFVGAATRNFPSAVAPFKLAANFR